MSAAHSEAARLSPNAFFAWKGCTDKHRSHELRRRDDVKLRIAQITDMHVPGEIELATRLRDFMSPKQHFGEVSHLANAIANQLNHRYRSSRQLYTNLLKKTLVGFHALDVDHVVITGDVAHCGLAPEFIEMRAVLDVTGWWGPERLTIVAGNHDRFNLYERLPSEPMEKFFDVVGSREPRLKLLPQGVALLELDSNRDRVEDRHFAERWLPNSVGRIYPEELSWVEKQQAEVRGMRTIVVMHHHISDDWHGRNIENVGGFMDPVEGATELVEAAELLDDRAVILHGHKHQLMPVDYAFGAHKVGCPGAFHDHLRFNIVDVDIHDEITFTQAQVRR